MTGGQGVFAGRVGRNVLLAGAVFAIGLIGLTAPAGAVIFCSGNNAYDGNPSSGGTRASSYDAQCVGKPDGTVVAGGSLSGAVSNEKRQSMIDEAFRQLTTGRPADEDYLDIDTVTGRLEDLPDQDWVIDEAIKRYQQLYTEMERLRYEIDQNIDDQNWNSWRIDQLRALLKSGEYETPDVAKVMLEEIEANKEGIKEFDKERQELFSQYQEVIAKMTELEKELGDREIPLETGLYDHKKYGMLQSAEGLPPDANFLDRLGRAQWWSKVSLGRNTNSESGFAVTNDTASLMIGATAPVEGKTNAGFALGYSHSYLNEGGGVETATDGLLLKINGDYALTGAVFLDGSASYGLNFIHNTDNGVTDDYLSHHFALSAGLGATYDFDAHWQAVGRLGYDASWSYKEASVDSVGGIEPARSSAFGAASATGTLQYRFDQGALFASATLNAVTHGRNTDPIDATLAAGMRHTISDMADLTIQGYVNSLFRSQVEGYGGSLRLGVEF